jgi:hypothetical protein
MTELDKRVLDTLVFFDSDEGLDFWKQSEGHPAPDRIADLCARAAFTQDMEIFEPLTWRVGDLLANRGAVEIAEIAA